MAFDVADGFMMLYAEGLGATPAAPCGHSEVWSFADNLWTKAVSTSAPNFNSVGMAYDVADGYMVLFGGCGTRSNQTWTYHAGAWTNVTTGVAPPSREAASLAYDPSSGSVLLFGGYVFANETTGAGYRSNDTWLYHGGFWRSVTQLLAPPARNLYSISTDSTDGSVLLFGGSGAGVQTAHSGRCCPDLSDAWSFSGESWHNITQVYGPSARVQAALSDDPVTSSVFLLGGEISATGGGGGGSLAGDTWALSGGTWRELWLGNNPPARVGGDLAYDPAEGYLVLFGGQGISGSFNDTWVLNEATTVPGSASSADPDNIDWIEVGTGSIVIVAVIALSFLRPPARPRPGS